MTLRVPILLTATSQTHTLVVFLSICILIFSAGLIEGLIKMEIFRRIGG
jgi:hypothetical protein